MPLLLGVRFNLVVCGFRSISCDSERVWGVHVLGKVVQLIADAFDTEQLLECLGNLKANKPVQIPKYDFTKHQRVSDKFRKVVDELPTLLPFMLTRQNFFRMFSVGVW